MTKRVAFLHTIASIVPQFTSLSQEMLPPGVEILHIVDEMLLRVVLAQGGLSPFIYRRVVQHAAAVAEAGIDVLQVTCSSISPCVDSARPLVDIPVLKIDEPMAAKAVTLGSTIGVIATAPTTLKPTGEMVLAMAEKAGKPVKVEPILRDDAYKALFAGDSSTHDRILRETIFELSTRTDVVLLAQASMVRVLESIHPSERRVPILTSPGLAMERLIEVLG